MYKIKDFLFYPEFNLNIEHNVIFIFVFIFICYFVTNEGMNHTVWYPGYQCGDYPAGLLMNFVNILLWYSMNMMFDINSFERLQSLAFISGTNR